MTDSDLVELAAYVPRVLGEDTAAWQELVARLEPHLIGLLRTSRTLGPLRHNIDDCRAVMLSVLERLSKDDHRGLRLFQPWADANPGKDFGDWIRIVTANMARDHVSSRLGSAGRFADANDVPLNKRMLNTLATLLPADDDNRLAFRPAMTNMQLARELLEYAERSLEGTQPQRSDRMFEGRTIDVCGFRERLSRGAGFRVRVPPVTVQLRGLHEVRLIDEVALTNRPPQIPSRMEGGARIHDDSGPRSLPTQCLERVLLVGGMPYRK